MSWRASPLNYKVGIGHQDRFQRLITTLRQVLECDASALLRYEGRQFIPLAIDGLAQDVLGQALHSGRAPATGSHCPCRGMWCVFRPDSDLPDPYDGLIPDQESLKVPRLYWAAAVRRANPDWRTHA
ncbi:anaerobic nitric oxide reductase transcription regulator [Citrobacter koseri]|nr:anaerobic nitric oxide reductase transcription regulator [Citrobacter koseri]